MQTALYFLVSCSCSQSKCLYLLKTGRLVFDGVISYWIKVFIPPNFEDFAGLPTDRAKGSTVPRQRTIPLSTPIAGIESSQEGPGDGPMKNGSLILFLPPMNLPSLLRTRS